MEVLKRSKTFFFNLFRNLFKISFFEYIILNYTIGRNPVSPVSKLVPNHYQYKPGSKRKVKRNGIKFELDISNFYDWYVYFGFEDDWLENIISFASPGDAVVDIGVNNGKSLLRMAKAVSKTGRVYGFEPAEENFYKANRNVSTNGFKNIQLHKIALGDKAQKVFLIQPNSFNHGLTYTTHVAGNEKQVRELQTVTLDSVLKNEIVNDVSIIHIDVEGYEWHVLQGSINTITKFKPALFFKIYKAKLSRVNSSPKMIFDFLNKNGYNIHNADTEEIISLTEIDQSVELAVYCLPKEIK